MPGKHKASLQFLNFKASDWSDYHWEQRLPLIDIPYYRVVNILEGCLGNQSLNYLLATTCQLQTNLQVNCFLCGRLFRHGHCELCRIYWSPCIPALTCGHKPSQAKRIELQIQVFFSKRLSGFSLRGRMKSSTIQEGLTVRASWGGLGIWPGFLLGTAGSSAETCCVVVQLITKTLDMWIIVKTFCISIYGV